MIIEGFHSRDVYTNVNYFEVSLHRRITIRAVNDCLPNFF